MGNPIEVSSDEVWVKCSDRLPVCEGEYNKKKSLCIRYANDQYYSGKMFYDKIFLEGMVGYIPDDKLQYYYWLDEDKIKELQLKIKQQQETIDELTKAAANHFLELKKQGVI